MSVNTIGRGYLEHMAEAFTEARGRTLDINACQYAFKMAKKVPYGFRQALDPERREPDAEKRVTDARSPRQARN